jgi:hypothetical protein
VNIGIFAARRNAGDGPKNKQDGIIIFFRGPKTPEPYSLKTEADFFDISSGSSLTFRKSCNTIKQV